MSSLSCGVVSECDGLKQAQMKLGHVYILISSSLFSVGLARRLKEIEGTQRDMGSRFGDFFEGRSTSFHVDLDLLRFRLNQSTANAALHRAGWIIFSQALAKMLQLWVSGHTQAQVHFPRPPTFVLV